MARHNKDFDEISFREIIDLTKRSWKWFLLASLFAAIGTWLQFLKQPLYSAKAHLTIQKTDSSPLQAMTARFSGVNPYSIDESQNLKPYVEYIYSAHVKRKVAEKLLKEKAYNVIDDLDLSTKSLRARIYRLTGSEFFAVEKKHLYNPGMIMFLLNGKLGVNTGNQDTVTITVRTKSPESSIYMANMILDFATESVLANDLKELDGAKGFIQEQLSDVEGKISKIQRSVVNLKRSYARATSGAGGHDSHEAISKIKSEVTESKAELVQTQNLIKQLGSNKSDYINVNRLQRLKREEIFIKSRLDSLIQVQDDLMAAKEQLPDFEQTIQNLSREQEFQYMYSAELKKQLLQIDVQRISFQNKIRDITRAGSQTVYKRSVPVKKVIVGCLVACLLVLVMMFIIEHLTPVVRGKKDLTDHGYKYMGNIPDLHVNNVDSLVNKIKGPETQKREFHDAIVPEAGVPKYDEMQSYVFGAIRSKIIHYMDHQNRPAHVMSVISPRAGDGKTLLCARMAMIFSQIGRRVLLIDGDMMKQDLTSLMGHKKKEGLADVLEYGTDPMQFVVGSPNYDNLFFLPAGESSQHKSDLIINGRFESKLQKLKKNFEMIIIDTPAMLLAHDAVVPMRQADLILMSVTEGVTRMEDIEKMKDEMSVVSGAEVGFVLNRSGRIGEYYYYSSGTSKKSA